MVRSRNKVIVGEPVVGEYEFKCLQEYKIIYKLRGIVQR